jgi:hypothetical protein
MGVGAAIYIFLQQKNAACNFILCTFNVLQFYCRLYGDDVDSTRLWLAVLKMVYADIASRMNIQYQVKKVCFKLQTDLKLGTDMAAQLWERDMS